MADNTERITILLQARDKDFARAMDRSNKVIARLERDTRKNMSGMAQSVDQGLSRAAVGIRAFAGGIVGGILAQSFAGIVTQARQVVRGIASIGDEAQRAGVSTTVFQEWAYVANTNRISVDALTDGLKELSLRTDEFVVTGAGPAADAFNRLGFTAGELATAIEDPSELLLEITDRMQALDSAARIRVADELFGGTGGERFVQLINQGEAALRGTIDRSYEVGAVMDQELIAKAAELDRRFNDLTTTTSNFFKLFVVEIVDAGVKIATLRDDLDDMFRSYDQARGLLGDDVAEALEADSDAADQNAETIGNLRRVYEDLGDQALRLAPLLEQASIQLRSMGYDEQAQEIAAMAETARDLTSGMQDGTVAADEFKDGLRRVATEASIAFSEIAAIDRAEFSSVTAGLNGLIGGLQRAYAAAASLRSQLPGGAALPGRVESQRRRSENVQIAPPPVAPVAPGRPESRPGDIDFGYSGPGVGGGAPSGGGGGVARLSEFERLAKSTRDEIAKLNAEAVELAAVAQGGVDVGDALEYARRRAELLYAAQADGRTITPALRAEIDQLAMSYVVAGDEAERAADRLSAMEENAKRGANAISDIFLSVLNGSASPLDALGRLLMRIAEVQIQSTILGAAGSGGFFGFLGSALGGARAGGGPVQAGVPYRVNENTPNSEVFVPSRGGGILNVSQARDALRGQSGGSSTSMAITINLAGANGDAAIEAAAMRGVTRAVEQVGLKLASDPSYGKAY